ncbi:MAG: cysteine hydrolase [Gemmatimonadaceae bacterium]
MRRPALLVIDVLNDLFLEPPLSAQRDRLTSGINELASIFRERGHPVIWVRQEFKADLSDAFLDMRRHKQQRTIAGTPGSQLVSELDVRVDDVVVVKKRYSAFFRTTLEETLAARNIDGLVVAGVNTHACVRMTVIDAYQRDMEVIIASDCTSSYDEEHDRVTRRYLKDKIARLLTNPEIAAVVLAG